MKTVRINGTANTWEKRFFDVSVPQSGWTAVADYDTAKYRTEIQLEGVSEDMTAEVIFAPDDADAGIFSGGCLVGTGRVTLLANVLPLADVTIPVVIVSKVAR